jgi:hypothetical protein
MAAIYSSAIQVLAFLGPHPEAVDAATDRVLEYLQDAKEPSMTAMSMAMKNDMSMFHQQPYFDRVWVLQEVGLARLAYLITMKKMIHWDNDSIQKVLQLCSGINALPPSILSWAPAQPASGQSLLEALHRSRNCSLLTCGTKCSVCSDLPIRGNFPNPSHWIILFRLQKSSQKQHSLWSKPATSTSSSTSFLQVRGGSMYTLRRVGYHSGASKTYISQ